MSIATEIQRLAEAKTAIAEAIENKGVTVPPNATLSDFAQLIEQIETTPQ